MLRVVYVFGQESMMTEFMLGNNLNDCLYIRTTTHSNQIQQSKSHHYPEPESPLCRAELVDEGEGSELR